MYGALAVAGEQTAASPPLPPQAVAGQSHPGTLPPLVSCCDRTTLTVDPNRNNTSNKQERLRGGEEEVMVIINNGGVSYLQTNKPNYHGTCLSRSNNVDGDSKRSVWCICFAFVCVCCVCVLYGTV
mmetsp:Transcript_4259/g.10633  ORF Transcript_4259/g.10633 Transcript_4259/m.10633 type:complete len:126 (-) Transcript_4259:2159-2536(-)